MGITALKFVIGEVNRQFYGLKLRFTAPLTRRRKRKFPTIKPPIYLPKWKIGMQLTPKWKNISLVKRVKYERSKVKEIYCGEKMRQL